MAPFERCIGIRASPDAGTEDEARRRYAEEKDVFIDIDAPTPLRRRRCTDAAVSTVIKENNPIHEFPQ